VRQQRISKCFYVKFNYDNDETNASLPNEYAGILKILRI
jgi:hypothetical protein